MLSSPVKASCFDGVLFFYRFIYVCLKKNVFHKIFSSSCSQDCRTSVKNVIFAYCSVLVVVSDSTPVFGSAQDTSRYYNAWPNPVGDELQISEIAEFEGSETTYRVYDTNGNREAGGSFRDYSRVSFDALPSGIYFIQLANGTIVGQVKKLRK